LAAEANELSSSSNALLRCNLPLTLIGHPDLPVQYSSITAKPENGRSKIEKYAQATTIIAPGMRLLFSAPIFSAAEKTDNSFFTAFNQIQEVLASCNMQSSTIARTWLFMEDIIGDYELLNKARARFFQNRFSSPPYFYPASTGIQGHLASHKPLSIEFCAFSGERIEIKQQFSPLQNEATEYGKLFSRAVAVRFPRNTLIFISGTASIDKSGASLYPRDFISQMKFTMEIIFAILNQAKGNFSHVAQAIVYLKHSKDLSQCLRILDEMKFPVARALFQLGTSVCRDDLLFEMEITAIISSKPL
jgi:enamine deaminase RidA (YjgF/YER057c/UK114 family)